jgi:predicted nucleic acid-binding protein
MIVTLDVSAAVELVMGRPRREPVRAALERAQIVIAPSLFVCELANTMWKYHRLGGVDIDTLLRMARRASALVDEFVDPEAVWEEALALVCQIDHPVYDALYLVTSRRRHAQLVTIDSRLAAAAADLHIPVAALA